MKSDVIQADRGFFFKIKPIGATAAELLAPQSDSYGFLLLESTLSAYGRGKYAFQASGPIDRLVLSAAEARDSDWKNRLDSFIGDRSRFCALFFDYDLSNNLGAKPITADELETESEDSSARLIALKYERVEKIEIDTRDTEKPDAISTDKIAPSEILSAPDRERYLESVRQVKEHIREGDIYQANLTAEWRIASVEKPWNVYCRLRRLNPSQYGGYANLGNRIIISSSPERLVSVDGNQIIANPIKGTIKTGETEEETQANKQALLSSEKDRAELLMIVDLLRNDLGRLCEYGSVHTQEIWRPEIYSSLIHLVGEIRGRLCAGISLTDIIQAVFPGGSITGAPKKRAIEILREIEGRKRGIYTGSFGYVYQDQIDLNIAIRTISYSDGIYSVQAGGGIVADSDPAAEYDEMCLKARNLLRAIDPALRT